MQSGGGEAAARVRHRRVTYLERAPAGAPSVAYRETTRDSRSSRSASAGAEAAAGKRRTTDALSPTMRS